MTIDCEFEFASIRKLNLFLVKKFSLNIFFVPQWLLHKSLFTKKLFKVS